MKSQTIFIFSVFLLLASCEKHERRNGEKEKSGWVEKVVTTDNGPMKKEKSPVISMKLKFLRLSMLKL